MASSLASITPEQYAMLKAENHDAEIYSVVIVFTTLAVIATVLRITSRHMKNVAIGADDILIMIGLILAVAESVWMAVGVHSYGLGRHLITLGKNPLHGVAQLQKHWYITGILQPTSLTATKLSVLGLYHRIFIQRTFRVLTRALVVIVILWWIGTFFADVLFCVPVKHVWQLDTPAHCGNRYLLGILEAVFWIATDLAVLIMPLPFIWQLHLPTIQRVGLGGLFVMGGFSLVSSCVRFSTLFFNQTEDLTWEIAPSAIWTVIEVDVTVVAACLILSRPWFLKIYPKRFVSVVRERLLSRSRSSDKKGYDSPRKRRRFPNFSSFAHLSESPPRLTERSMGAPFAIDLERNMNTDASYVRSKHNSEMQGLTTLEAVHLAS